jgi:hypothetical protein
MLQIWVPGVGPIVSLSFVALVDDPTRLSKTSDVGAYAAFIWDRWPQRVAGPVRTAPTGAARRIRTSLRMDSDAAPISNRGHATQQEQRRG